MKDYVLTVRFSIEALDDPAARAEALRILHKYGINLRAEGLDTKLQELPPGNPPRKVQMD